MEKLVAMTGAEFRCAREYLGLSTQWMADYLNIKERELFRWEKSEAAIPDGVAGDVDDLMEAASTIVRRMVPVYREMLRDSPSGEVILETYRKDEEYWQRVDKTGERRFPARWHRMIAARVAEQVPGLILDYP